LLKEFYGRGPTPPREAKGAGSDGILDYEIDGERRRPI